MEQHQGTEPPRDEGTAMSSEELAEMTGDLLSNLYDDQLLTDCYRQLLHGAVPAAMRALEKELNARLLDSSDPEWRGFVQLCMLHPVKKLLHEDPFTRMAHDKPRGYPGDPGLLDFIYGVEGGQSPPADTSELGRQIFAYTTQTRICDGVRTLARTVAQTVDRLALESRRLHVLSVISGHLREAGYSEALAHGQVGRWVAFDSDADSLQEIRRCYGAQGVETVAGTVRQVVAGKLQLGEFDLIYAAGIYNYLEQQVGRRLTENLFRSLRPGGRLLISNFLPGVPERGYMESFMDWHQIYRSPDQIQELAEGIDPEAISDQRLSVGDGEGQANIGILHVVKT